MYLLKGLAIGCMVAAIFWLSVLTFSDLTDIQEVKALGWTSVNLLIANLLKSVIDESE